MWHREWGVLKVKQYLGISLLPTGVFSLKRSTVGAFTVPLRILNWTNMTGNNVLCKYWNLLGRKQFKLHPQNRIMVPLKEFVSKFLTSTPSFLYGSAPANSYHHPCPPSANSPGLSSNLPQSNQIYRCPVCVTESWAPGYKWKHLKYLSCSYFGIFRPN